MNELLNKQVKIIFNSSTGINSGIVGTTGVVVGFSEGFVIVREDGKDLYYALCNIKSISISEEQQC